MAVTVTEADSGSSAQYDYDETPAASVTVYVTISNDGKPLLSNGGGSVVMANLEVTVPYFDLGLYGLDAYYRYHTENGQGAYVDNVDCSPSTHCTCTSIFWSGITWDWTSPSAAGVLPAF